MIKMCIYSFLSNDYEYDTPRIPSLTSEDKACIHSNEFECMYLYDNKCICTHF